ncbi:TetR/AcrR family transcriptional regulator [Pseudomonas sp. NPDC089569]|uniref:TetR/AcrR family transcriptional regulator n=1 Tax=Pseudomonas sp. NPDC089569 TaxID=3390722 RepID=UPI003D005605
MTTASAHPVPSARDRLLDAAAELFATRGFQAVGLRDLASHLGLHAGSLYHHIENKQSLLFELIESALSDLLQETLHRIKGARSPRARLRLFIQAFVAFSFNEPCRLALMTREFANLNEEQQQPIIQLKNKYASVLGAIIADEQGVKGKPGSDCCPTTNAAIVMLFGQSQWYSREATESQLAQTLTDVLMCLIAGSRKNQGSSNATTRLSTIALHAGNDRTE